MLGFSTFLLLTCGLVSIQGYRPSSTNANVNSNVNSFRRNYNGNSKANFLNRDRYRYPYLPIQRPLIYYNDEADGEAQAALDPIDEISPNEEDERTEAVAKIAANAALTITKQLADDMGDSAAIAIADAVSRILSSRVRKIPRNSIGRRNSNFNSNYNLNIMGRASGLQNSEDRKPNVDDNASHLESSDTQYGLSNYITSRDDRWNPRTTNKLVPFYVGYEPASRASQINAGILHDDETVTETEEPIPSPAEAVDTPEDLISSTPNAEQPPVGNRSWGAANVNSNVNSNNFGPSGHRRNVNSNVNQNMFRRNLNANSNTNFNGYRRNNANFNSNSNRINPHYYRN